SHGLTPAVSTGKIYELMKFLFLTFGSLLVFAVAAMADPTITSAQQKLKRLGFYQGTVDGSYGSQTAAAIRRYQLAEDLRVTGELNPQTLNSLGIKPAAPATKQPSAQATPVPQYVALADLFKGGPFISVGPELQIASIRQAQKNLKLLGYYQGPTNGSPSISLVSALKAWQKSAGFRQSGRFDENTLKGLDIMRN
ncbi:MAG: peptidoglycan-binding domain-containing protein, partial [Terrimicrobiaceae bacterium]